MGLGNKLVNKFNFGANDTDGDDDVPDQCSICIEKVSTDGDRAWAILQCTHKFHLDCIGSAFNAKGVMQCPNCRKVEKGQWLYANGTTAGGGGGRARSPSYHEFNVEDWIQDEESLDIGGGYTEMSIGVHYCPFERSRRLSSFDDGEYSPSPYHDLFGHHGYYTEPPAAPTASTHPCPYVTYFGPVPSSSSSTNSTAGSSDSSSYNNHWNNGSSVSGEVQTTPYGFPVDPLYHNNWDYNSPPPPPPSQSQHFSSSGAHFISSTQPIPPLTTSRTSRANNSDVSRARPPLYMLPFGHSSSVSSVATVQRTTPPPFPGSSARNRDRVQALQAYYQQQSADSATVSSRGNVYSSGRTSGGRGIGSGMGSSSSSSDQGGGSGFIRFNIWERDPYLQQSQQQGYPVNQMEREPSSINWASSFNEGGFGSFYQSQRHGGAGGGL